MKPSKNHQKSLKKPLFNKNGKSLDLFKKHRKLKGVNNVNPNDRLEILKANYEREIQDTETKLHELKAKLATLITLAQESEKLTNPESNPDKYANKGLTDAILDAVNCLKSVTASGATASQIRDYLIAHGFTPNEENPHNFSIAASITLKRLAESGRVHRTPLESGNYYKPVQRPQGSSLRRFGRIGTGMLRTK
jgi:hypothetical protein